MVDPKKGVNKEEKTQENSSEELLEATDSVEEEHIFIYWQ